MTTAISQCLFSLTSHHDRAYELSMDFSDWRGTSLSKKQIQFTQDRAPVEERIWDVASINSKCGSPHFSWSDYKDIKAALAHYTAASSTDPIIVTLDLKDSHNKYFSSEGSLGEISSQEDDVCAFFQNSALDDSVKSEAVKIHGLFSSIHPVDFVLREGSLKKDLLKSGIFSDREIAFFQGLSEGSQAFCQTAEFFMNALKLGSVARTSAGDFPLEKYVTCLGRVPRSFGPYETSTVLYSQLYEKMYSIDGIFFRTLSSVFRIEGAFDVKSKITMVNVAAKV